MSKQFSVAGVVVTYNRRELLRECLQALLSQTRPLDEIIVIDNASTDGTDKMISKEFPQVTYVRMSENIGGAGGFHEGMKLAYEKGYDWIWVMDDDGIPRRECLERLLEVGTRGFHYLAPNLYDENEKSHFEDRFKIARTNIINFRGGLFNGVLLSAELVRAVGYPMKNLFICGDETEYCNRIMESGFPMVTISNAIHYHRRTVIDTRTFRYGFYFVRNKICCWRLFLGIYRSKTVYLVGILIEITRFILKSLLVLNLRQVVAALRGFIHGWVDDLFSAQKECLWWGIRETVSQERRQQ